MKIYDKEIFKKREILKSTVLLLVVFLLGFATGYIANIDKKEMQTLENKIEEQKVLINEYESNNINI